MDMIRGKALKTIEIDKERDERARRLLNQGIAGFGSNAPWELPRIV